MTRPFGEQNVSNPICPKCGHHAGGESTACPLCGDASNIGCQMKKPPAPPEVSGWIIEPTPPDLLAWARQTLNREEILAELEEVKRTGGLQLEDFIGEIEERIKSGG